MSVVIVEVVPAKVSDMVGVPSALVSSAMVELCCPLTSGIASYNQQIAQAEANGDNASALHDARDHMLQEPTGTMEMQVKIDNQDN
ncbi:FlgK family flagellar hook-associated protein, partial [Escherichia coli]|uniref:FlgK family flagellar hook-associated protein n=1 Tax=Escherichia coli TaxID=562 RepID=UPI003D76C673